MDRNDWLVVLMEEAAEIIQAATKCQRFGFKRNWPNYGVNHEVLAKEVGDLLGVVDILDLDWSLIESHRKSKQEKVLKWKEFINSYPSE